jgi:predicted polyphosphate/ATP-dependent NAD kinase
VFKLGVIINPCAGLGGSVGLKGSDGTATQEEARARGAEARAMKRMQRTLHTLIDLRESIQIYCFAGDMGENSARELGFNHSVIGHQAQQQTSATDTCTAAKQLHQIGVDLLLFAGGDGTARNIADAVRLEQVVLGVPSGVKMHSGVFAISPEAAGQIVRALITHQLVPLAERDVKDIDEEAFRQGQVRTRWYASLRVPEAQHFLQRAKNSGVQANELAQRDLAHGLIEQLEDGVLYIVGPGSTTQIFLQELGVEGSLLGVDLLQNRTLFGCDLSAGEIFSAIEDHLGPIKIIITAIGGQGLVIGRGNQQLTPEILRRVGKQNICIIATPEKLLALAGRPLLVDSNDAELDQMFSGFIPVVTGYRETVLYPIGLDPESTVSSP